MNDLFSLIGRVALVTGGTQGIGLAIALALAKAGAKVCVNGRSEKKLAACREYFLKEGLYTNTFRFDVTDERDVDRGISSVEKTVGPVDILVNNAGIIKRVPLKDMELDDFKQVVETDLIAPFIVSKRVSAGMIEKRKGKIINICSMMSEYGRNSVAAYASAKGGLKLLTKNMTCEWAKYNIQVNGIGPGYIATD
ncbi:MAG TPA: SDR family NAD(P)-dependent oxidoreductase, partial [Bacteroidales bacterium]|nr:SDR family NAD(P)-dependent oxidoreductase [Bacteroidales bacterium]